MTDKFSVYYTSNDSLGNVTECQCRNVDADQAFKWFRHHTTNVSANVGWTARVIIVDSGDCVVAEWKFGHGLTWPKEDSDG